MKAYASKTELAIAVGAIEKAIGGNGYNTITLEASRAIGKEGIELTASNGEITIKSFVKADVHREGSLDTVGKAFVDAVKKITDEDIALEQQGDGEKDKRLAIIYGAGQIKLPAMAPLAKPLFSGVEEEPAFSINTETFKSLVKRVCAFAAKDDTRPLLRGIHMRIEGDQLVAVGLDGYRMAKISVKLDYVRRKDIDIIVPASSLKTVATLASEETLDVFRANNGSGLHFRIWPTVISTQLLTGQFINSDSVIPKGFTTTTTFNREAFLQALERSTIVSDTTNRIVSLSVLEKELRISSESNAGLLDEVIEATTDGGEVNIKFNAGYLMEMLKNFREERATLKLNGSTSPVVAEEADALYLALPMR